MKTHRTSPLTNAQRYARYLESHRVRKIHVYGDVLDRLAVIRRERGWTIDQVLNAALDALDERV